MKEGGTIEIGARIKEVRTSFGLSQSAFSTALGISRSALSKLESGENIPSERTLLLIARVYGVSDEWLRTENGEMFLSASSSVDLSALFCRLLAVLPRLTANQQLLLERKLNEFFAEF